MSRRFDLRCVKAGVRRIGVHDIRRTRGLLLAALDVHPGVVMQILRRSKISITMVIYTTVSDKQTLAALKRLSDALDSPDATLPDDAELTTCCCTPLRMGTGVRKIREAKVTRTPGLLDANHLGKLLHGTGQQGREVAAHGHVERLRVGARAYRCRGI